MIWPRSFLDPASEPWRKKVESDTDANSTAVKKYGASISALSSAVAALRGRVARTAEPKRGSVAIIGNGGTEITASVTFDSEYGAPPVVVAAPAGSGALDSGTSGTGAANLSQWGNCAAYSVSETGFMVSLSRASGTFSTSTYYFVSWIALPA